VNEEEGSLSESLQRKGERLAEYTLTKAGPNNRKRAPVKQSRLYEKLNTVPL